MKTTASNLITSFINLETVWLLVTMSIHWYWFMAFIDLPAQFETYGAPLIPLVSSLGSFITGMQTDLVVTRIILIFFILNTVGVYLLVKYITHRKTSAYIAALLANLPIWWFAKTKLTSGLIYGDSAHMVAVSLFPFVMLFLLQFLRYGKFNYFIKTVVCISLVSLVSPFSVLMVMFLCGITTFSEVLLGFGRVKIVRLISVIIVTVGLVAFWYNPGAVISFFNSQRGLETAAIFSQLIPVSFVLLPILGTIGFLLFERRPHLQPLFLSITMFLVYFLIYSVGELEGQIFDVKSERFLPEVGLSISILLGIIIEKILIRINNIPIIGRYLSDGKSVRFITLGLLWLVTFVSIAWLSPVDLIAEEMSWMQEGITSPFEHTVIVEQSHWLQIVSGSLITGLTLGGLVYIKKRGLV